MFKYCIIRADRDMATDSRCLVCSRTPGLRAVKLRACCGARMIRPGKRVQYSRNIARRCMAGLVLVTFNVQSIRAEQAPPKRCASISKQEYDAARKQSLLRSRYGDYVR